MSKNLIIPQQILSARDENLTILPMYVYMEAKVGKDGTLLTSLELLMRSCGYSYNRQSKKLGHINVVAETLHYLKSIDYIESIYDKYGKEPIDEIDVGKPGAFFTVKINQEMEVRNAGGFCQMFIDDYTKIIDYTNTASLSLLGKMLYVWCFIGRHMYRRHKNYIDDYRYEAENLDMAKHTPNYFFANYDKMSDLLGEGFSRSTLIRILKILEECGVLHYKSVNGSKSCSDDSRKRLGSVFVLHSKYWETELNSAIEIERGKRLDYIRKEKE